ncbi:TPA: spore coat protein U domain-containing protein [Burkholderia stabilis]|nr:spore coat protein U domain-containing protein [Burkholderia stabilis]HDR9496610.1 spore coat protein U domain-containing protein [Burkholderia stabilis]HDR9521079.1 spore coat protein U domain-containing protein [Burkholderia stabilis]HDR9528322.1 spore coat protein U domain-containing protein [Burkholderia stabilis]HDR9528830.1 spore coat protein U domain-containing protein [Burkholderia stabilis]
MWLRNACALLSSAFMFPATGIADTPIPTTKAFTVSAQIVSGCGVSGGGTGLDFGLLDFGTYPAVSVGQVNTVTTGSVLQIQCSSGTTLKIAVDGGLNPSSGNTQRNLQGPGQTLIGYRLYADAAHTQTLNIGQPVSIPVSGVASLPIYGSLSLPGGTAPAGTYTDTAQVTVSY